MMKRSKRFAALILTGVMAATTLFGCGSSSGGAASDSSAADSSSNKVLKVGMECAYAPFNWTQDTDTTPDGSKAVKIAGSDYYAYGYDVAVAQKLADQMGMDLYRLSSWMRMIHSQVMMNCIKYRCLHGRDSQSRNRFNRYGTARGRMGHGNVTV